MEKLARYFLEQISLPLFEYQKWWKQRDKFGKAL